MIPSRKNESRPRGPAWAWFAWAWCAESSSVFGFAPGLKGTEKISTWYQRFKKFKSYDPTSIHEIFRVFSRFLNIGKNE